MQAEWRKVMNLYHGSNVWIDSINLAMCRPNKDFGTGFYLTDIKEQAERMAIRVSKILENRHRKSGHDL